MVELLNAIDSIVANVMPEKIRSLADDIRRCGDAQNVSRLHQWPNNPQLQLHLNRLIESWERTPVSPVELAGMLIGASHAYQTAKAEETNELVWTGPSSALMSTRRTEQALLEVIQSAQESLFLVSFVAFEVSSISQALNSAIQSGVKVSILMEPAESAGGYAKEDCLASMNYAVPGSTLYTWSEENKAEQGGGYRLVHAKCSVADGKVAFITSANLTSAALERNMELGVLIRGNHTPKRLHDHLNSLISTNIIVQYRS